MMKKDSQMTDRDRLEVLSLEVTTNCNLRCTNCFALATLPEKSAMEYSTAAEIISGGFDCGFRMLHMTGGEPLMWKHLFPIIDYALNLGYEDILINTNATLLDSKISKRLASYNGVVKLTCSLNGPENIHDSIRGTGSFKKAERGIRNGLNEGLSIDIFTTVGKDLLPEIPYFTDYVFQSFPDIQGLFFIQLRRVEDDYFPLMDNMLTPSDFLGLVRMVGFISMLGRPVYFLENPLVNAAAAQMGLKSIPESPAITRFGKICILQDGKITANHSSRDNYGYYRPGALPEVLKSAEYLEDTADNKVDCPLCVFKNICSDRGKLYPSGKYRSDKNDGSLFCRNVLEELS